MKLKQTVWDSLAAAEEEQARRCMAVTWKRATAGGSGGSGGMTGESEIQAGRSNTVTAADLEEAGDMTEE